MIRHASTHGYILSLHSLTTPSHCIPNLRLFSSALFDLFPHAFAFALAPCPSRSLLPPTPQGTKYIVDGILFKFSFPADDSPYIGSYECANKAAGHDLRGAISIYHAIEDENNANEADDDVNLNCNLMAIIDCLGTCQTLLKW